MLWGAHFCIDLYDMQWYLDSVPKEALYGTHICTHADSKVFPVMHALFCMDWLWYAVLLKASGQRAPEADETPGAQGLLLIGDIGYEKHETPSDFQKHPEAKLDVKINFQNVAGVAKYL